MQNKQQPQSGDLFFRAVAYDQSIDWPARLAREIPVLTDVFGPPGPGGLLDAGCGSGRQVCALSQRGYRVTGIDAAEEMLVVARRHAADAAVEARFVHGSYADLPSLGSGFDGVYCLANSLAAAATRDAVRDAIGQFAACLRPGGRLFVQVLNFTPMREQSPCVRGPRVATVDGCEFISLRHFQFDDEGLMVTNLTVWNDGGWKQRAQNRRLYPLTLDELRVWSRESGLRIDNVWGSYAGEAFNLKRSTDLIVVATRP